MRESAQLGNSRKPRLGPAHQLEAWDATANVRYDAELWNELCSLRFLETHAHVAIVGPVGVGKTFLAHAASTCHPPGMKRPSYRARADERAAAGLATTRARGAPL